MLQTKFSVPEDSEAELDDEIQTLLTNDFEIGHYIRERIVPRAVLYYTGILQLRINITSHIFVDCKLYLILIYFKLNFITFILT